MSENRSHEEETLHQLQETTETTNKIYALQVVQAVLITRNIALQGGDTLGRECVNFIETEAVQILQEWRANQG